MNIACRAVVSRGLRRQNSGGSLGWAFNRDL
jgi:hypothetical protein